MQKLSLAMLAEIDQGRLGVAWDQALQRAEADCRDRPGVEKERVVTLTMTLSPTMNEHGELRFVRTSFEVGEKTPKRRSADYEMAARPGGLFYSEFSPDDADQASLAFTEPRDVTPPSETDDEAPEGETKNAAG